MMRVADFGDRGGLSSDGFSEAFDFDEENSRAVHGKPRGYSLRRAQRPAVEHFTRGGSDGAGGDVDDGVGGIVDGIEDGEKRFTDFGLREALP